MSSQKLSGFCWINWVKKLAIHKDDGFAFLTATIASSVLLMFVASVMTVAMYQAREADRWRKSNEAHFLARAAVADAIYRLKADYESITEDTYISEPRSLFSDTVQGERRYRYLMEPAGDIHFAGTRFMTGSFRIEAVGTRGDRHRGIETRIERDTFLRYSRFVQQGNLSYGGNANIMADLYVGGDLNLNGSPVTFWGDLEVGGSINNEWRGRYYGDISGTDGGIDLSDSVDLDHYRSLAQGSMPGEGTGVYLASATSIDLSLFDFTGPVTKYDGNPLPGDFNGVIFCERDINVEGTLEGRSLTFVSADDIIATDNVRTGNTMTDSRRSNPTMNFNSAKGVEQVMIRSLSDIISPDTTVLKLRTSGAKWNKLRMYLLKDGVRVQDKYADLVREPGSPDEQMVVINNLELDTSAHTYSVEIHYNSDGNGANPTWVEACDGDPVNAGFVAKDEFYIHANTPRQLTIDAAILTRDRSWEALGGRNDHPDGYDAGQWDLTINGPIITYQGGSAGPWSSYGNRYYNYDRDMIEFAPPAFPVPSEWWKLAYWWHLRESEITL